MAGDLLSQYAVGGAQRPDSFSGLDQAFASSLARMFQESPPEIQQQLRITSGFRSPDLQKQLFADAVAKYGSEQAARKWVAPPGKSRHNHGGAVDLKFLDPSAQKWAHENAANYGLQFPMSWEPWHVEMAGSRSAPVANASQQQPTQAPQDASAPMAFGDVVAPQPVPTFADALANFTQRRAAREEEQAADQARRQALANLLADLVGS